MPVAAAASADEAEAAAAVAAARRRRGENDDSETRAPAPASASATASARGAASSPLSTPTTATSPVSPTFLSVAGRVSTPLSLFVDSAPSSSSGKRKNKLLASPTSSTSAEPESAATVRQRYLAMSSPTAVSATTAHQSMLLVEGSSTAAERMRRGLQVEEGEVEEEEYDDDVDETSWRERSTGAAGSGPPLPWSANPNNSSAGNSNITAAAAAAAFSPDPVTSAAGDIKHDISRGVISAPLPQSPNARARPGQHEPPSNPARDSGIASAATALVTAAAADNLTPDPNITTTATTAALWSPAAAASSTGLGLPRRSAAEDPPLHTGSVQPGTKLAHPKPILHIATDAATTSSRHSQSSDLLPRSASAVSNIAHLEATAERLSMTSSIDDAIRELHCELKRSDSRRSSILAARAASADEHSATGRLRRYPSNSSSSAAAAARQKGYSSPAAAYVMSPTNSLTGRMRSGSNASAGRPEHDAINSILSRHGPGKSSVRSVRSAKPSLAEISESEPISLTQHVLDQVDAVPPIEHVEANPRTIIEQDAIGVPHTHEFHDMIEGGFRSQRASNLVLVNPDLPAHYDDDDDHYEAERPMTANSTNTFQVAQDAFVDFDGAHCETDNEDDRFATADMGGLPSQKRERLPDMLHLQQQQQQQPYQQPLLTPQAPQMMPPHPPVAVEDNLPTPQRSSAEFVRPQSYFDHQTGQHMLYYPARVPAMLNLPPKLSSKPKAAERNERRSQLLSAMMQPKDNKRKSVVPDLDQFALPDPLSGHRNSFAALSVADRLEDVDDDATTPTPFLEEPAPQSRHGSAPSVEDLRRPQRLSKMDTDKRKSNMASLDNIPPHLRASVFFEQPSEVPEIEVKDGSAMATLDSILDASATAPVSAFTDHLYAGKLGSEVYGKEKKKTKHKSQQLSTNTLGVALADPSSKGQSTVKLLTKRSQSSLLGGPVHGSDPSVMHDDGHAEGHEQQEEEDEEPEEGIFDGMPTTLLGEIHLRKQRQKERVLNQGNAPQGMRATLLEMDAVAEMQRKQRLKNRVNLAWEEQNVPAEHHLSDDEDVPLAVIAALQQGAKNMADLERPMGLMEVREREENEPLSQRAARLQGRASTTFAKRQSNLSLPATRMAEVQPPAPSPRIITPDAGADDDARTTITLGAAAAAEEIEEETLGARKRRLAESQLPKARPVSNAFSTELLSQFGDLDESKGKNDGKSPNPGGEEETLGQRRRRLQAEREAREREMSYGNLTGERLVSYGHLTGEPVRKTLSRRVSMADMLSVHQVVEDPRIAESRRQQEEHMRIAEQEAKMAAMRAQMPTALVTPGNARTGGFKGGLYNDGTGGIGIEAARSSAALNTFQSRSFTNTGPRARATMVMPPQGYGMPQGGLQPSYSTLTGFNPAAMNSMNPMNGMNTMSMYGAGNMYGANGLIRPSTSMNMPNGSMDRVERWRQGVFP